MLYEFFFQLAIDFLEYLLYYCSMLNIKTESKMITYEVNLKIDDGTDKANDLIGLRFNDKKEAIEAVKMLDRFIPFYEKKLRLTLASFEGNKLKDLLIDTILWN